MTGNEIWREMAVSAITEGDRVSPNNTPTRELLDAHYSLDMRFPLMSYQERKLDYQFMAAEALWILEGSDRLDHSPQIQRIWAKYSDNGVTTSGAYGPPVRGQLPYVVNELNRDRTSRRALLTIWRQSPEPGLKDYACTVAMQFLIRNNYLHTIVTMRSQDLWLGFPYDVFNFTMISMMVAGCVEQRPDMGKLHVHVGSLHVYEKNLEQIKKVIQADPLDYPPLNLVGPGRLMNFLDVMRNKPSEMEFLRDVWMIDHIINPKDEA